MDYRSNIGISTEMLKRDFEAERKNHLNLIKHMCDYVFGSKEVGLDVLEQKRNVILNDYSLCYMEPPSDIFDNLTNFVLSVLNMNKYWIIITDAFNKQITYTNPQARAFLYDMDSKTSFCEHECDLLAQLVNLNLKSDMEHHIDLKCELSNRYLSSDSFVFVWQGKESILHFISDETNFMISKTQDATQEMKLKMLEEAYIDSFTGCFNKRFSYHTLSELIANKEYFSLALVNLNGVGYINKNYGYEKGNEYITYIVKLLRETVREYDLLGRYAGGEFLLIIHHCDEIDATIKLRNINTQIQEETSAINFGISYGIKEVGINNSLDLFEVVSEVHKKMQFFKQLHRVKYSNYDEIFSIGNKERLLNLEDNYLVARDTNLNIANLAQYEIDKERMGFDKVFVGRVETADISIAVGGSDTYYKATREILSIVEDKLDKNTMRLYAFDYKTFVIAAVEDYSNDAFLVGMRQMSEQFAFATSEGTGMSGVTRFAVVMNHDNLLETALALLIEKQKEHGNFFVYDDSVENSSLLDESKTIEVIQTALQQNGVTPYYQGIRNNETGIIDTYEALMRIVDNKGRVYAPYYFLDTAKKYKFYEKFTYLMVEQVLSDFKERTERVSINVTTSDIKTKQFRHWFYEKIQNFPDSSRLILEIVEAEEYQNDEVLADFMETIKGYGVKIAIDDFGAGYSNLGKVIDLKPDIIKIDGSIIKNICDDEHSAQILSVIVSMAKVLNAYIVAEFIENEEIQEVIEQFDIAYSQGYLYAKPLPIDKI